MNPPDKAARHMAEQETRDLAMIRQRGSNRPHRAVQTDIPATIRSHDDEGRPRKQSDVLLDIGRQHTLFHGDDGTAYALVGRAVYAVESTAYRETLARDFLDLTNKGANRNSMADAVTTLAAIAKHRGDRRPVWLRTASTDGGIVIDAGRDDRRSIEVRAAGWSWVDRGPMFRRTMGMQALPEPGSPDFGLLWKYVNVAEEHRALVAAWMLAALRPTGPYPILFLSGEQGTGKSTAARVLRRLIDPSASLLRTPPKEVRDLLVGALNGWILALDNLSFLGPQLSDALCRISTGGAISERALYTNTDEILIEVQRPVIVNGIEEMATRPDLVERGLHIELELIDGRMAEAAFWRAFESDAPRIFGALVAGLSAAIRDHETINIGRLPRMADFAQWAAAGIGTLGFTAEEFMFAYRDNLDTGMTAGVDSSPVGRALTTFMLARPEWCGTASDLLSALTSVASGAENTQAWPRTPRGLSGALRRLAPALRRQGIEIRTERGADRSRARLIRLCSSPEQPSKPSEQSANKPPLDDTDGMDGSPPQLHQVEIDL